MVGRGNQFPDSLRPEVMLAGLSHPLQPQLGCYQLGLGASLLDDPGLPSRALGLAAVFGGFDERLRDASYPPGHSRLAVSALLQPSLDLEATLPEQFSEMTSGFRLQLRLVVREDPGVERSQLVVGVQGAD